MNKTLEFMRSTVGSIKGGLIFGVALGLVCVAIWYYMEATRIGTKFLPSLTTPRFALVFGTGMGWVIACMVGGIAKLIRYLKKHKPDAAGWGYLLFLFPILLLVITVMTFLGRQVGRTYVPDNQISST